MKPPTLNDSAHVIKKELEMKDSVQIISASLMSLVLFGCSQPMTTREKGATVGTFTGAGLGAIIGSATGNAGAGAGIGAAVGLLGGAVIGDQMQSRQRQDQEVQRQIAAQQAEIERQQRELNYLKAQQFNQR
jgi:outer membrane lipoprotein SlyB